MRQTVNMGLGCVTDDIKDAHLLQSSNGDHTVASPCGARTKATKAEPRPKMDMILVLSKRDRTLFVADFTYFQNDRK